MTIVQTRLIERLSADEQRITAVQRLGEAFAKIDALNLPPISDDEIEAEVQAARDARR